MIPRVIFFLLCLLAICTSDGSWRRNRYGNLYRTYEDGSYEYRNQDGSTYYSAGYGPKRGRSVWESFVQGLIDGLGDALMNPWTTDDAEEQ
jgi:hypothetical protein